MKESEQLRSKGFLPVSEVARRIGKHVQTVYWWANEQKIQSVYVGAHRYINWASVVRYYSKSDPAGASLLGIAKETTQ